MGTLFLPDIIENFWIMCHKIYELDTPRVVTEQGGA